MNLTDKLNDVEVLTEYDRDDFSNYNYTEINAVSKKAVMIDGEWLPKSQIRLDFDGNIYVANWLLNKKF